MSDLFLKCLIPPWNFHFDSLYVHQCCWQMFWAALQWQSLILTSKQLFALSEGQSALDVLPVLVDHEVTVLLIHLHAICTVSALMSLTHLLIW